MYAQPVPNGTGQLNGGSGGNAFCAYRNNGGSNTGDSYGGGAGNPGGPVDYGGGSMGQPGANGTGGLLIIIAKSIINNGIIESNGSNGGNGTYQGKGSGGGAIHLLYSNIYKNTGKISSIGGAVGGGNGSFKIYKISDAFSSL